MPNHIDLQNLKFILNLNYSSRQINYFRILLISKTLTEEDFKKKIKNQHKLPFPYLKNSFTILVKTLKIRLLLLLIFLKNVHSLNTELFIQLVKILYCCISNDYKHKISSRLILNSLKSIIAVVLISSNVVEANLQIQSNNFGYLKQLIGKSIN